MTASKILPRFRELISGSASDLDACIDWEWHRNPKGYGVLRYEGGVRLAHRVAYAEAWGLTLADIEGAVIRHTCDVRSCINPCHLLSGTQADNVNDMIERGRSKLGDHYKEKTHCPSGHLYDSKNTYASKDGRRYCRACHRARSRTRKLSARERVRKLMAAKLARPKEA